MAEGSGRQPTPDTQPPDPRLDRAPAGRPDRGSDGLPGGGGEDAEHDDRSPPLQDGPRRTLRRHSRLPRGEDRPPAPAGHPAGWSAATTSSSPTGTPPTPSMRGTASTRSASPPTSFPTRAKGGTWNEIGSPRTARRSRGRTSRSRPGAGSGWNGDAGHGRGNHLHLSWIALRAKPGHPARVVYTRKCPTAPDKPPPPPDPKPKPVTGGTSSSGIRHRDRRALRRGLDRLGCRTGWRPRLAPVVPEDL